MRHSTKKNKREELVESAYWIFWIVYEHLTSAVKNRLYLLRTLRLLGRWNV
jgi:hypothetical protein